MKAKLTLIFVIATNALAQDAAPPSDRFKQLDKNADGKLNLDEVASLPGLSRLFSTVDTDKDGALSRDEIRAASARWPGLGVLTGAPAPANSARPNPPRPGNGSRPAGDQSASKGLWDGASILFDYQCGHLDDAMRFFRDGIGMREVPADGESRLLEFGGAYLRLRAGGQADVKAGKSGNPMQQVIAANGFRYCSLIVRDLPAVEARLVKAGFPKPVNYQIVSMAIAPDGTIVELIPAGTREERLIAGIIVGEEAAARNFYEKKLGLAHEESRPQPAAWGSGKMHVLGAAAAQLKLAQPGGERPAGIDRRRPGIMGMTILVADLAVARRELDQRGLKPQPSGSDTVPDFADPDGNPIRIAPLDSVASIAAAPKPAAVVNLDGFQPVVEALGDPALGYIDPEYDNENYRITFQDTQRRIWLGDLDPKSGKFKTATGADLLLAEDTIAANVSKNGPEFALDREGWSVFFTKNDQQGVSQTWRTRLEKSGPQIEQLTHLPDGSAGALVSQNAALDRTWFGFLQGSGSQFKALFGHTKAPDEPVAIPDYQIGNGGARFVLDSADMLDAVRNADTGRNEVMRQNLETGQSERLLNEPSVERYYDAWIFRAPEFGGEETLVTTTDRTKIVFYCNVGSREKASWQRAAQLSLPPGFPHRRIFSMEPILGIDKKTDRSWVFFEARAADAWGSENSVWVASPGLGGREAILRRVDDGAITKITAMRTEPESLVGDNEVFLYYSFRSLAGGRGGGLRMAKTGIAWAGDGAKSKAAKASAAPAKSAVNDPTNRFTSSASSTAAKIGVVFRRAEIAGLTDTPTAVNGFAIADLNRDGLPDAIATRQVRTTFFARPGQELPLDRLDVLINRGGMKFEPHVIQITGSDLTPEKFGASAEVPNLADFNGDGFLDLFITRSGGAKQQKHGNTLLLSDGAWDKFRDVSAAMGVQNRDGYNRQSCIADVNGDGWLDIAIGCDTIGRPDRYGTPPSRLFVFQPKGAKFADGRFEDIAGTRGLEDFGGYTGDPAKDKAGPSISLRDLDNDGDLDLVQTYHADMTGASQTDREAAGNYAQGVWVWKNLLRETGEFRFQRVTDNGLAEYAKLRWSAEKQFYEATAIGSGLPYFAFADTDNDGLLDMLAIGPNSTYWAPRAEYTGGRFWKNLGGFRFERATEKVGLASLDWNYKQLYEHNGWPLIPQMRDTSPRKAAGPQHKQPGLPSFGIGGNHPYFADIIFGDFDNDGWQDVVCLDRAELPGLTTYAHFYRNEHGTFRLLKTTDTGLDAGGIAGEAADLNGDGLLDLVFAADPITSSAGRKPDPERFQSKCLINTGAMGSKANHWLRLKFSGATDAELIGARVEVTADGMKQTRWIHSNHSYKSGGALDAHFGLDL